MLPTVVVAMSRTGYETATSVSNRPAVIVPLSTDLQRPRRPRRARGRPCPAGVAPRNMASVQHVLPFQPQLHWRLSIDAMRSVKLFCALRHIPCLSSRNKENPLVPNPGRGGFLRPLSKRTCEAIRRCCALRRGRSGPSSPRGHASSRRPRGASAPRHRGRAR